MHTRPFSPRFSRGIAAVIAAATVLAVSACSADTGASTSSSSTEEHELKLAIQTAVSTLDPAQVNDGQAAYVWSALYDTLIIKDNDGKLQPSAAESWEYSDGNTTLTLDLREDMTFSDGNPVTADDVVATMERTRTTPGIQSPALSAVESIEATDDSTVVLHLAQPDAGLLTALSLGIGIVAEASTLDSETIVGSGAYVLDPSTVDGSTYVLTKRDDYWNADAYPFSKLTFRVIQDPTATFNALQAGELTAGTVQPGQEATFEGQGYNVAKIEASSTLSILILDRNGEIVPALKDVRVRQAINMAFDRETMVTALAKFGRATDQVFGPKDPAFNEDVDGYYDFDPTAAKKLLADAGYPDGFSITMPSTVFTPTFEPTITQSLGDIGITVTWEAVPPANTGTVITGKQFPLVVFIEGIGPAVKSANTNYSPTGFANPFGYTDPELDALFTEAGTAADDDALNATLSKISAFAVENALNATLFDIGSIYVTAPDTVYLNYSTDSSVRSFGLKE